MKTLVMAEKFRHSDYVRILRDIIPELDFATNPLDLGHIAEFPMLKNIVLMGDTQVKGMLNFKDLDSIHTAKDAELLFYREKQINFEDATNI